jgi:superfamily I DNA/RNA helicase
VPSSRRPAISGGTFHHIANRILRMYGKQLGISPDFTILDREDAKDLLASCIEGAGVDIRQRRFPQKNVLAAISSFLQNTLEPLEAVISKRFPMFTQELTASRCSCSTREEAAAAAPGLRRSAQRVAAADG